jgi:hypothetical protein
MPTFVPGLRPALIACLVGLVLAVPVPARAAVRHDAWNLHPGSHGPRVASLQWLLSGGKPYAFTEVKPTFKYATNGAFGARTKAAVTAMKFRIGYPTAGECGAKGTMLVASTGPQFFAILEGKQKRPACWVALAAARVRAIVAAQPSKIALAWRDVLVSQLGITETYYSRSPHYFNNGPCISSSCTYHGHRFPALQSSTGQYDVAWCVSTQQEDAMLVGYGHFADDTAGVYYAVDYYAARNLTFAKPKFGSLVAFITYNSRGQRVSGTGHMGFVVAVQANSFTYIAGNDSNGVREHTIPDGSRPYLFIRLPNVA